jgi:hypothetical protein
VPANRVVEYMVVERLAGEDAFFCVLRNVLAGLSPSEVARACGTTKYIVRSYIVRVGEKGTTSTRALVVAKHALPIVEKLVPVAVVQDGGAPLCTICREAVDIKPQQHIAQSHKDVVERYTELVISTMRQSLKQKTGWVTPVQTPCKS